MNRNQYTLYNVMNVHILHFVKVYYLSKKVLELFYEKLRWKMGKKIILFIKLGEIK